MIESVHAILMVDDLYALQLRDDKPGVAGAGLWGLFGGTLHPAESPASGLGRELFEELRIQVDAPRLFWSFDGTAEFSPVAKRWWVFEVDVSPQWRRLPSAKARRRGSSTFPTSRRWTTPMTREVLVRHHAARRGAA